MRHLHLRGAKIECIWPKHCKPLIVNHVGLFLLCSFFAIYTHFYEVGLKDRMSPLLKHSILIKLKNWENWSAFYLSVRRYTPHISPLVPWPHAERHGFRTGAMCWQVVIIQYDAWKSKSKQRMIFMIIHVKESLLPRGKVCSVATSCDIT